DHAGRTDEAPRGDRVAGIVRQVLAGNPVDRSVEVGAGVLAEMEGVPVPARAFVVVPGNHLDRHPGRGGELRRQTDHRSVRTEGLGQIDDPDTSGVELGHELLEDAHRRSPSAGPAEDTRLRRWRWN